MFAVAYLVTSRNDFVESDVDGDDDGDDSYQDEACVMVGGLISVSMGVPKFVRANPLRLFVQG